ncbi:MAG: alpha-amylase family glycosyl hydrolase, partial [Saprospiraceae bacterium]
EVWSDPILLTTLFKGLPSLFNFELTKAIPDCINGSNPMEFIDSYAHIDSVYRTSTVPFEDAILLCNHDMNRIRSRLGGDIAKSKLAASLLLTLPGTPYIYYGEEIGMLGMKPDENNREPFLWGGEAGDGEGQETHWMKPLYSVVPNVTPLELQKADPNSIYNYYKKWIMLRSDHPEIASGKLEFLKMESPAILAYTLSGINEKYLVLHNLSNQPALISVPNNSVLLSDDQIKIVDNKINVEGFSTMLIKISLP